MCGVGSLLDAVGTTSDDFDPARFTTEPGNTSYLHCECGHSAHIRLL